MAVLAIPPLPALAPTAVPLPPVVTFLLAKAPMLVVLAAVYLRIDRFGEYYLQFWSLHHP